MFEGKKIAVVIPCYNVSKAIERVIGNMPEFVDLIVAVEDGAKDNTLEKLRALVPNNPRLVLHEHGVNKGLGAAMANGFRVCLEREMDIVVKMDGDDQMDPAYLPNLIRPVVDGVCDYAKGNRFLHMDDLRSMPKMRLMGNIILTFLTKLASGYWNVFDPQNGYVAISRAALKSVRLHELESRRYFFENQMLIELNIREAVVMDVAIPARYGDEESSLKISRIITYFPILLLRGALDRLLQRYVLRNFSIIVPFLFFGLVMIGFGAIFGGVKWYQSLKHNIPASAGTVMLAVLPLIWGLQLFLQAILMDILATPQPRRGEKRLE